LQLLPPFATRNDLRAAKVGHVVHHGLQHRRPHRRAGRAGEPGKCSESGCAQLCQMGARQALGSKDGVEGGRKAVDININPVFFLQRPGRRARQRRGSQGGSGRRADERRCQLFHDIGEHLTVGQPHRGVVAPCDEVEPSLGRVGQQPTVRLGPQHDHGRRSRCWAGSGSVGTHMRTHASGQ
jgi:hypothetical protein